MGDKKLVKIAIDKIKDAGALLFGKYEELEVAIQKGESITTEQNDYLRFLIKGAQSLVDTIEQLGYKELLVEISKVNSLAIRIGKKLDKAKIVPDARDPFLKDKQVDAIIEAHVQNKSSNGPTISTEQAAILYEKVDEAIKVHLIVLTEGYAKYGISNTITKRSINTHAKLIIAYNVLERNVSKLPAPIASKYLHVLRTALNRSGLIINNSTVNREY